jgi:hypothetical protein
MPNFTAESTALLFSLGRVPGCANEMALIWVLGAAPKVVSSAQNIFDVVFN